MKPSATGAISAKADELRRKGRRVYNFSVGDIILRNHPLLIEAAQKVLHEGVSPYPPIAGLFELRTAASQWMNERYGSSYSVEQTVVTTGGKFGIYAALQVLLNPGDEVIIPAPYWVSYPEMVQLAKGKPVIVQTRWKLTPELLQKAITPKTKALILNNACNPTGALYSREELEALMQVALKAKLWIISDEVYSEIVFDGAQFISLAQFPSMQERCIIIESCSKNFAMAGWRVGFAFGPQKIIDQIIALQSHSTTSTSYMSQKVALAAVQNWKTVAEYVRESLRPRRKLFFDTLQVEAPPSAIYYFAKVDGCEEILEKTGVALVPGAAFGTPGYARFSFSATESEIREGLKAFLQKNQSA
ncbi:MAG: pyridoxal phosphate-dependent aminotransferase [Verrucomicrobia bacterium]|nr:pyridoxal phosphate-dependent aminotransferase [Verrucomicrobiota bacterium]MDE3047922.1 pyridoxal phosphate-dependent aminotransferase [Verrucomicrobiota bacterium]